MDVAPSSGGQVDHRLMIVGANQPLIVTLAVRRSRPLSSGEVSASAPLNAFRRERAQRGHGCDRERTEHAADASDDVERAADRSEAPASLTSVVIGAGRRRRWARARPPRAWMLTRWPVAHRPGEPPRVVCRGEVVR